MARRRWRPSREAAEVEDVAGGDGAAEVEASAGGDDARWRAAAQVGEEQGAVAAADVDVDDVHGRGDGADLRAGEEQDGGRAAEGAAMGGRSVASPGRAGRRGARAGDLANLGIESSIPTLNRIDNPFSTDCSLPPVLKTLLYRL